MMHKSFSLIGLLVVVLSALLIAGCGGSSMPLEDDPALMDADRAAQELIIKDPVAPDGAATVIDATVDAPDTAEPVKGVSGGDFFFPVGFPVEQNIGGIYYKLEMLENGQGIYRFKMLMRNDSHAMQIFKYPTTERFDVSMSLNGVEKWRANKGKHFASYPWYNPLGGWDNFFPGETRSYQIDWNGRGNGGEVLPNGMYTVKGTITSAVPFRPSLSANRWYSLGGF